MTAQWFLGFCLAWYALVGYLLRTHLPRRAAALALGSLALWMFYASSLAYQGWLRSPDLPPRILLLLLPLIAFAIWLAGSAAPMALVRGISLRMLTGLQSFRILVEVFLMELWKEGLLPKGMTWEGHNLDILTGVTALVLFLFWDRIPKAAAVAKAWNAAGLVLLAQVAVTGALSAPGPQHILNRDTPNLAIVSFPYVLIAALFVMSALALHILSLRKIALLKREGGG